MKEILSEIDETCVDFNTGVYLGEDLLKPVSIRVTIVDSKKELGEDITLEDVIFLRKEFLRFLGYMYDEKNMYRFVRYFFKDPYNRSIFLLGEDSKKILRFEKNDNNYWGWLYLNDMCAPEDKDFILTWYNITRLNSSFVTFMLGDLNYQIDIKLDNSIFRFDNEKFKRFIIYNNRFYKQVIKDILFRKKVAHENNLNYETFDYNSERDPKFGYEILMNPNIE